MPYIPKTIIDGKEYTTREITSVLEWAKRRNISRAFEEGFTLALECEIDPSEVTACRMWIRKNKGRLAKAALEQADRWEGEREDLLREESMTLSGQIADYILTEWEQHGKGGHSKWQKVIRKHIRADGVDPV